MNLTYFLRVFAAVALTVTGTAISWNGTDVYAANINCAGTSTFCLGTNEADNMIGDDKVNQICGRGGNDNIVLRGNPIGVEVGAGNTGNDIISGGEGDDTLVGDNPFGFSSLACTVAPQAGLDRLSGGPGNDNLFHGHTGPAGAELTSDGHRDYLDCGPGNGDRASINTSVDGDIAVNCEFVNSG
jgi:Ca2+-binding RTX toxin-like protein